MGTYGHEKASGDFVPEGWRPEFDRFFDTAFEAGEGLGEALDWGEERA
jgi:hypothetical protein